MNKMEHGNEQIIEKETQRTLWEAMTEKPIDRGWGKSLLGNIAFKVRTK